MRKRLQKSLDMDKELRYKAGEILHTLCRDPREDRFGEQPSQPDSASTCSCFPATTEPASAGPKLGGIQDRPGKL